MMEMLNALLDFAFSPFGIWLPMLAVMMPVVAVIDHRNRQDERRLDRIWHRLNRGRSRK